MKYRVKKGDTLSGISQRYTTTGNWHQLSAYNMISNPNKIYVDQLVEIPESMLKKEFIKSGPLPKEMYRPKEYKYKPKQFSTEQYNYVKLSPSTRKKNKLQPKKLNKIAKPSQKDTEQGYSDILSQVQKAHRAQIKTSPVIYKDWKLNTLKSVLGEETGKDIHGVLFGGNHSVKERFQMLSNGIQSKLGIGGQPSSTIKSKIHNQSKNKKNNKVFKDVIDQMFANESRYGDTIKVDEDFYIIPESINLNSVKLGSRNRGSRDPFNTKGGLISTYKQILPFEAGDFKKYDSEGHINHFFGYDKSSSPKVGPLDLFGPGDTLTQVYYSQLLNIPKDNNGEYLYGPGSKSKSRKSPLADLRGEPTVDNQGQSSRRGLLIMTGHKTKNFSPDDFGMAGGGAYIVKAGDELRLIRGSVNNVMQELELIQKNHKGHPITLYEVDNGSYNRGLRPLDNNYSAQELAKYDAQNTDYEPGGHFFYIKRNGGKLEILKSLRQ